MRRTFVVLSCLTSLTLTLGGVAACAGPKTQSKASPAAAPSPTGLPSDPAAALRWAATQTQAAGSAKIAASSQSPVGGPAEVIKGALSWGGSPQASTEISGIPALQQLSSDGSVPMVVTDGAMYLKATSPAMVRQSAGRHWMKLGFAALAALPPGSEGNTMGRQMSILTKQLSPGIELSALARTTGLRNAGPELMDGVRTTHFTGSVSRQQLLDAMTGLTPDERAYLEKQDQAAGVGTETVDVWLDAHGLPIRTEDHALTNQGALDVDRHFSDYGSQVLVTTPDAADTIDLAAVLKAVGGGGGTGGSV
jgi:hypothetical protein